MFSLLLAAAAMAAPTPAEPLATIAEADQMMTPADNPGSWATNDDYPASAMLEEREGTAGFRLTVDATGTTTGCEITSSSGHADLDAATCRLMLERARFIPGTDARGRPVGGTYSNRIRWQIPEGHDHFPDGGGFGFHMAPDTWPRSPLPGPATMGLKPADHYPPDALAAHEEGVVAVRLGLDSAGKVAECTVTASSGSDSLDRATCAMIEHDGEFIPALDGDGKPTNGRLSLHYSWTLPPEAVPDEAALARALDDLPPRLPDFPMGDPASATLSMLIGADGSVRECQFEGTTKAGGMAGGSALCDMLGGDRRYAPYRDADGKPVARRIHFSTTLTVDEIPEAAESPK